MSSQEPSGPLDERDQRELREMGTQRSATPSFPTGCLVSLALLVGVFFLIVGICSRG